MGASPRSDTVKHLLGNSVKIDAVVKLKIGDKEIEIRDDPPTQNFFNDLFAELFASTPSAVLKSIGTIRIVDSVGESACDISGSSLKLSSSNNQVTATGSCTYNSYEAPSTIRLISYGTNLVYFEIPVPSGTSAQTGLPVTVTWNATITVSQDSASGYLAGATFTSTNLQNDIASVLAGKRGSIILTLQYTEMIGISGSQTNVSILSKTQLTRDSTNKRAYLPPTKVATAGQIQYVYIYAYYNSQYVTYLRWTLSPYLTVNANDYVSLDVSFYSG